MTMGSKLLLITIQLLMDMFHKIQILPAGIQKPILEIHPDTGGGNISQLVYLTPTQILEQGLFTHNEMTLKYYIT